MKGEKRLWMKDETITTEIYKQHLKPTLFNNNMKILTTEHHVPKYLKKLFSKKTGKNCKLN